MVSCTRSSPKPPCPAARASGASAGWMGFTSMETSSSQAFHELHRDLLAGRDGPARVLQPEDAVRLGHRAQHARALLAGGAHLPLAALPVEDASLVFGPSGNLPDLLRRDGFQERDGVIVVLAHAV